MHRADRRLAGHGGAPPPSTYGNGEVRYGSMLSKFGTVDALVDDCDRGATSLVMK
jgi:hypothetical protein